MFKINIYIYELSSKSCNFSKEPIGLKGGDIEAMDDEFTYLGSLITASGKMDADFN